MTMMISKFHRLVQSKKVWGAFAVLISVAFIFAFNGARSDGNNQKRGSEIAGKLFGEKVSISEYTIAERDIRLHSLFAGQTLPGDMLRQETWFRLMKLKKSEQLGISATDEQVSMVILNDMGLKNESGKIDRERYNAFLNDDLLRYDIKISDDEFIEFIRKEITLNTLESIGSQGALATQSDIKESYHQLNDALTVDYAAIPREQAPEPEVTLENKKNYFEKNKAMFAFPETKIVQFVSFPATDYTNEVEVTEEQITNYYEATKYNNYVAEEPILEDGAENPEPTYKPLEEVRDDVIVEVSKLLGLQEANAKTARLFKQLGRGEISLEELANEQNLTLFTSAALSEIEAIGDVDESEEVALWLTQKAFDITETRKQSIYNCFSDPLMGENAVYLMECIEINETRLPETFEDVENLVTKAVTQEAIENAYQEKAREILSSIQEALSSGSSFEEAVDQCKLEISTVGPFSRMNMPEDYNEYVIANQTYTLEPGTLSDKLILQTKEPEEEDGETLIECAVAYATDKTPADFSTADEEELKSIKTSILSYEAQNLFDAWQADLIREAALDDLLD